MNGFVATSVVCHSDADHMLHVKASSVQRHWDGLDETDRKIRKGVIRAYCLDESCPDHTRHHVVGLTKIPTLGDLVNLDD